MAHLVTAEPAVKELWTQVQERYGNYFDKMKYDIVFGYASIIIDNLIRKLFPDKDHLLLSIFKGQIIYSSPYLLIHLQGFFERIDDGASAVIVFQGQ